MSQQPPGYAPNQMSPADERLWATLIHLSGFLIPFWGAMIGYLVFKDRGPFIRHHTAEAFNFQIAILVYSIATVFLVFITFGLLLPLVFALGIASIVFIVLAAVRSNEGRWYRYPLTIIRFVS